MAPPKIPIKDRFWDKVKKAGPDDCWPWQGYCLSNGYGIIYDGRKPLYAHRVCWGLRGKKIRKGCHVLHRCDNRPCVNPRHLWIGRNRDNISDKVSKGRQLKGEQIVQSRLTVSQVLAVRADDRYQRVIAAELGIKQSTVSRIKNRKTWAHV